MFISNVWVTKKVTKDSSNTLLRLITFSAQTLILNLPNSIFLAYYSYDGSMDLTTGEFYNPAANTWSATTPMGTRRSCLGTIYILGQKVFSFSYEVVHLFSSWLAWGRNQVQYACCYAQKFHKLEPVCCKKWQKVVPDQLLRRGPLK